jgi:hypothetical protein
MVIDAAFALNNHSTKVGGRAANGPNACAFEIGWGRFLDNFIGMVDAEASATSCIAALAIYMRKHLA